MRDREIYPLIVNAEEWDYLFRAWEAGTLAPGDRYLTQSDGLWIACDNSNGDFLVEEFNTREEALGWLRGEFEVFDSDPDLLDYEEVDGELVWADGERVEGIVDYDQKRLFEDTVDLVIDRVISELQQGLSFGKGTLETIRTEIKAGRNDG